MDNVKVAKELVNLAKDLTADTNDFYKAEKSIIVARKIISAMEKNLILLKDHLKDLNYGKFDGDNKAGIKQSEYLEEKINTDTKRFLREVKDAVNNMVDVKK